MKTFKKTLFVLVAIFSINGCVDSTYSELPELDRVSLEKIVSEKTSFVQYVNTAALNHYSLVGLTRVERELLNTLHENALRQVSQENVKLLYDFYVSIGYDRLAHNYFESLLEELGAKYRFTMTDLNAVLQNGVHSKIIGSQRLPSNAQMPIGGGCVAPCQSNANAAWDYRIDSATSDIERSILAGQKEAYFAGCYEYCINNP